MFFTTSYLDNRELFEYMSLKGQLQTLVAKHKEECTALIESGLKDAVRDLDIFKKYPVLKSIEVETIEEYDDSSYYTSLNFDAYYIKINGYSLNQLEEGQDDDSENPIDDDTRSIIAEELEDFFKNTLDSHILVHLYGSGFSIKIDPQFISIKI